MKTFPTIFLIALIELLTLSQLSAQNYTPQTKQEMIEMLAKRCDESPAFIQEILGASVAVESIYNIPASVMLSIIIAESDGLQSTLSKKANNCMGLTKSNEWHGPVYCEFKEVWNDVSFTNETIETCYRVYDSLEDCIFDFAYFITNERRWWYNDAFEKCAMDDTACWIQAMMAVPNEPRCLPASQNWSDNCLNIIHVYGLKLADAKLVKSAVQF